MGQFKIGQSPVARTMRPTLNTPGIEHRTPTDQATKRIIIDASIKQAREERRRLV